jgi:hypothetical protein
MTIGKGKRSAPKRDFMQVGRAIVEQAIGEQMDLVHVLQLLPHSSDFARYSGNGSWNHTDPLPSVRGRAGDGGTGGHKL